MANKHLNIRLKKGQLPYTVKEGWPFSKNLDTCTVGGDRGVGTQEKGYGRRERKKREAGVFRGREVGDHIDKRLKKNIINNNFSIIMLFELHIASKYTNDTSVLSGKNPPLINSP